MDLLTFCDKSIDKSFWHDATKVSFTGIDPVPIVFFNFWFSKLKKIGCISVIYLDLTTVQVAQAKVQLQTSFLGSKSVYWLGNLDQLSAKEQKIWHSFCESYKGPNTLLYFSSQLSPGIKLKQSFVVSCPSVVDKTLFVSFLSLIDSALPRTVRTVIEAIFQRTEKISFDTTWLLIMYLRLIGRNQSAFVNQWLDKLLVPQKSLFTLSQHFFSKNKELFFSTWKIVSVLYPPAFWCVFWSEQLFRAGNFVVLKNQRRFSDAKRIAYKLPFSFIQRDWQQYRSHELNCAHDALYTIDFSLKNGGGVHRLDHFFGKFLHSVFQK